MQGARSRNRGIHAPVGDPSSPRVSPQKSVVALADNSKMPGTISAATNARILLDACAMGLELTFGVSGSHPQLLGRPGRYLSE